ncbi:Phosphoglycerate kinase [Fragilaria crotonensis]|nr:Phosphoglycerate kinase [Fragilaria crotonensis]
MPTLNVKKSVDNLWPVRNKKVLIRVDYNVPIKHGIISNDYRIRSTLPTLEKILQQGGSVILMSHLGRPKGVSYKDALADEELHKYHKETWRVEKGTGKTSFFAHLSGEDKKQILGWSSKAGESAELSSEAGSGKCYLFSTLPEEEKKSLLDRLVEERRHQESDFPHLREYNGYVEELSLAPVATRLEELLRANNPDALPVLFADDCLHADEKVAQLKPGQALLLENLRFYREESTKDAESRLLMARKLASYGDYFVSDAFGTAHRDSASMTGIPHVLGHGAAGYLMHREIEAFARVLGDSPTPVVAIVGGAKVSDKILLLDNLLNRIDELIIGGAMAYTFLKAQGFDVARSFCEAGQSYTDKYGETRDIVELATNLLAKAKANNIAVHLPIDHVCHTSCALTDTPVVTQDANVPDGCMALDIGPKTIAQFEDVISRCKTAIWNGPMGVFELEPFSKGTYAVAKAMGDGTESRGLLSIIGGGDSASAAEKSGQAVRMSHVSTGGGASLELLEGKILPGVRALDDV